MKKPGTFFERVIRLTKILLWNRLIQLFWNDKDNGKYNLWSGKKTFFNFFIANSWFWNKISRLSYENFFTFNYALKLENYDSGDRERYVAWIVRILSGAYSFQPDVSLFPTEIWSVDFPLASARWMFPKIKCHANSLCCIQLGRFTLPLLMLFIM